MVIDRAESSQIEYMPENETHRAEFFVSQVGDLIETSNPTEVEQGPSHVHF